MDLDKILEESLEELKENEFSLEKIQPPESFYNIINDFINDIHLTFPECSFIIKKWWNDENKPLQTKFVFDHCMKILPLKTFEIINENEEIFQKQNNTEFLPNILFCHLWETEISENTRKIIWKYLNSILACLLSSIKIDNEMIQDHPALLTKLSEIMKNVSLDEKENSSDFQEKFKEMTGGKIGKIAAELAEETAKTLNMDDNPDGMMNLLKDPTKLMNIVKNMGDKLEERMKSGEIDENEIMNEGIDLMKKMKDMPGMGDMGNLFKMFEGFTDMKPSQKGALATKINQNSKLEATKERLRKKQKKKIDPEIEKIEQLKDSFKKSF
uniref:Uncharacterized protein n=1 Tax=viral metagenome TaxID=1070528 RepID=A0A6C0HSJ8_9ZZZZ